MTFKSKEGIPGIRKLKSSCSCSTPTFNIETGILSVVYYPKKWPKSKPTAKAYTSVRTVTVFYENGDMEQLKFKAIIKR